MELHKKDKILVKFTNYWVEQVAQNKKPKLTKEELGAIHAYNDFLAEYGIFEESSKE